MLDDSQPVRGGMSWDSLPVTAFHLAFHHQILGCGDLQLLHFLLVKIYLKNIDVNYLKIQKLVKSSPWTNLLIMGMS